MNNSTLINNHNNSDSSCEKRYSRKCAVSGWICSFCVFVVFCVLLAIYMFVEMRDRVTFTQNYHNSSYHQMIVNKVNTAHTTWTPRYNPSAGDAPKGHSLHRDNFTAIRIAIKTGKTNEAKKKSTTTTDEPDYDYDSDAYNLQKDVMIRIQKNSHSDLPKDVLQKMLTDRTPIPAEFDARRRWPFCWTLHEIFDQGNCGVCWAASSASVMSDRICIATDGRVQPRISVEDLYTCCDICQKVDIEDGCMGGTPMNAFLQWKDAGVVTGGDYGSAQGCMPYSISSECGHPCPVQAYQSAKQCVRQCHPSYAKTYENDKHRGAWFLFDRLPSETEEVDLKQLYDNSSSTKTREFFQRELMRNGPIVVGISIYEDMQHYAKGVYNYVLGNKVAGHSIKLLGWGVENGHKYWLLADSYGRSIGENGFMKMSMDIPFEDFVFGVPMESDYAE